LLEERVIWINGKFVKFDQARVHIMSHSFARGSAIFEVMTVYDTAFGVGVFRLPEHLERLHNSARVLMMKLPYSKNKIFHAVLETVAKNRVTNGIVKLNAYYPEVGLEVIPFDKSVSFAAAAFQFGRDVTSSKFGEDQFASVGISKWRKAHPATVPVFAKASGSYLNPMLAKLEVRQRGFKTPILLDTSGFAAEGATESLFIVKGKKLLTPKLENILPSITRMSIFEIASDLKIPVREARITRQELLQADEAFFSSTTCKVWPISKIEKHQLPTPGPVTAKLRDYFDLILAGKVKKYRKWFSFVR
jgi:branched-chain amino acid aminotransferase